MVETVISIKQGSLKGIKRNNYHCFFGIPYAKPPIGQLRFKAPQPPEPWHGTLDATKEGNICYSRGFLNNKMSGSEDCLNLNVFTSQLPKTSSALKPVMFWIHPGSFYQGSSRIDIYNPDFLMAEDVVFVSINYRLGALGFLSLEDPSLGVPGNAGFKDMVMALKWVQGNIKQFSGDPDNVTIIGDSAGGAAVNLLMLSPMGKNLFHKAIALSGSSLNAWVYGTRCAGGMAKYFGCTSEDEKDILKVLQEVPVQELIKAQRTLHDPLWPNIKRPLGFVVEKFNKYEPAFLTDMPINIIKSGKYNKVPLLMGYNQKDGLTHVVLDKITKRDLTNVNFEKLVPFTINADEGTPLAARIGGMIKEFYFGNEELRAHNDKYFTMITDTSFAYGVYNTAKILSQNIGKPLYFYRFSLDGDLNFYRKIARIKKFKGTCHLDELGYIFNTDYNAPAKPGSIEDVTITRFTKYLTNFAKNGNPNPKYISTVFPITWPAVTADELHYIDIGENLTVGVNPDFDRMQFWDDLHCITPSKL